jgi:hypothetical protein
VPLIVQFRREFAYSRERIVSYRIGIARIRAAIVWNRAKTCKNVRYRGLREKTESGAWGDDSREILLEQPVAVELLDKYV